MSVPTETLVFADLETGGLALTRPIIQIASIAVDRSLNELEAFEVKVRFDESEAAPDSLRKNSYNRQTWQEHGRDPHDAARLFASFLRRHATVDLWSNEGKLYRVAQLAAHNAEFDGPFLRAWYVRNRMFLPAAYRVFCTIQRAVWLFQEHKDLTLPVDFRLTSLCEFFGVPVKKCDAHDAMADVRATVELYRAICNYSSAKRKSAAA